MSAPLVLSLFPGIGLLDRAFEEEGFCVVRGPDLLWGGDVRAFHPPPGRFDGVIGGPPCQRFSRLAALVRHAHGEDAVAEDLIPEYERCVAEAAPAWFLMENVEAAPLPVVPGYRVDAHLISDRDHAGGVSTRERRFSFGTRDGRPLALDWWAPPVPAERLNAAIGSGCTWQDGRPVSLHNAVEFRRSCRAQGLPDDFDLPHLTAKGRQKAVGNGVPLPMGRAVAQAVRRALCGELAKGAA